MTIFRKASILVADDEKPIRDFIRKNLEIRGYFVHTAENGEEALSIFVNHNIDLVILDIMMPIMDGFAATRKIRQLSTVPIIILTALGEESDKVMAFNLGADDYLSKPFGVGELLARIRAVFRRTRWTEAQVKDGEIKVGDIKVDLSAHQVIAYGKEIDLTPTEFNLLVFLMENMGRALTHNAILQHVWGPEYGEETEYLRVYIGHLRQKIEKDPRHPEYLLTERGIGYRFIEIHPPMTDD